MSDTNYRPSVRPAVWPFEFLGGVAIALVLAVASLPWVLRSLGRAMWGDFDGSDRVIDSSPLVRYLEWVARRSASTRP